MAEREIWFEARIGWNGGYMPVHWKGWVILGVFIATVLSVFFFSDWVFDHYFNWHWKYASLVAAVPVLLVFWFIAYRHCRLPGEGPERGDGDMPIPRLRKRRSKDD